MTETVRHDLCVAAARAEADGLLTFQPSRMKMNQDRRPPRLSVVPEAEVYDLGRGPETTADRVKRLQREARMLAREQAEALERKLVETAALAREIAEGGEAFPAGVREIANRIHTDLDGKEMTLRALVERTFVD